MAIRTEKSWKVIEQAHDGSGCGVVLASFTETTGGQIAANERAGRLASENPGTRYYIAVTERGVYQDRTGDIVCRTY